MLLLVLFLAVVSAAPARTNRFSTIEIPKTGFQRSPVLVSYARALSKLGEVPVSIRETLISNGHVVATPTTNDREYVSALKIGGQTLYLDLDTGSSDTWVFGPSLPANMTLGRPIYDDRISRTAVPLEGQSWSVGYGDFSSASGHVVLDTVQIGDAIIPEVAIEVADNISPHFKEQSGLSGMMGLAWPSINQVSPMKQLPVFFKALDRLQEPVFAAALGHGKPGSWDFGFIDREKYDGEIHWTNVDPEMGFWQIQSGSVKIDGKVFENNQTTIIDSGTSLLVMDPATVDKYYSQVWDAKTDPDSGVISFPCNATLPSFELDLQGHYARIDPKLMRYLDYQNGRCYGSLQTNYGSGRQIFGDILFKSQYIVHNGKTAQIGFAPQRGTV